MDIRDIEAAAILSTFAVSSATSFTTYSDTDVLKTEIARLRIDKSVLLKEVMYWRKMFAEQQRKQRRLQ